MSRGTALIVTGAAIASAFFLQPQAQACTRFVYHGVSDQVVTGRSMDWKVDVGTNLWVFPRRMARIGEAGPNSTTWTAKHGSIIASGYDIFTTDGMNEADPEDRKPSRDDCQRFQLYP